MTFLFLKTGVGLTLVSSAVLACAAECVAPASMQRASAAAQVEAAKYFEGQGNASCALAAWRGAYTQDPKSHVVLDGYARSLTASGDAGEAIRILHTTPRDAELTLELARAYTAAGKADEGLQTLSRALKADPSSARIAGALVVALAGHGQLDDAYRLADSFAQKYPHNLEAQKLYLRVLVATNDSTTGRPLARKLLTASPQDSELLYLNGVLDRKAGEFTAARGHLEKAIALTPNYADSHYNLGIALAGLQDHDGAAKELTRAIALGSTAPEVHLELAKALRQAGKDQLADEQMGQYQQAIRSNANHEMAKSKSTDADQAMAKGESAKAAALYREALEVTPQDGELAYKLALALDKTGDMAGERAALEQAVQIDPHMALAQHQLGYLIYTSGDYTSASQHFETAVQADPGFTQAWISLAATEAAQSRFAQAQDAVGHALRLEPQNKEALALRKALAAHTASR